MSWLLNILLLKANPKVRCRLIEQAVMLILSATVDFNLIEQVFAKRRYF